VHRLLEVVLIWAKAWGVEVLHMELGEGASFITSLSRGFLIVEAVSSFAFTGEGHLNLGAFAVLQIGDAVRTLLLRGGAVDSVVMNAAFPFLVEAFGSELFVGAALVALFAV